MKQRLQQLAIYVRDRRQWIFIWFAGFWIPAAWLCWAMATAAVRTGFVAAFNVLVAAWMGKVVAEFLRIAKQARLDAEREVRRRELISDVKTYALFARHCADEFNADGVVFFVLNGSAGTAAAAALRKDTIGESALLNDALEGIQQMKESPDWR